MLKISLKYKLLGSLSLLTLLPILTVGIFSYKILLNTLTENTKKKEMSILENQINNFNHVISNFELILNDLVTSESTQGFIQFRHDKESEIYYSDLLLLSSKVDSLMNQRGDAMNMVAFLWNDGELPLVRGNSSGIDLSGDYTNREPFASFLEADASIHWQVIWEEKPVIYAYRIIYESTANENTGVALINFQTAYFEGLLARNMDEGAFSVLLDDEGGLVYKTMEDTKMKMTQESIESVIRENSEKMEGEKGIFYTSILEKEYMVSYGKSDINEWKYLYFNPVSNIDKEIHAVVWMIIMVIILSAMAAFLATLMFYHYLNSPISCLNYAMCRLQEGDMDTRVAIKRRDELGLLGEGFNQMAEKIKQLIYDIEVEQGEKRRAEICFLQAQITPHFLYNTLNGIKSLARMQRTEEAAEMTTSLISLLRLSSSGNELIPLSQELEYVKNYIDIMSFRKNRSFQLESFLEEGTERCIIPKFSLQPFIENSIIHGFCEQEKEEYRIIIRAVWNREDILVCIEDNGKGFEPKEICEKQEEGIRFSHLGIRNVEERIHLYFGKEYGVEIDSAKGKGTRVWLHLPGKEQENLFFDRLN